MRKKFKGFSFQRTPIVALILMKYRGYDFEATPLEISDWAQRIFMAAEFNNELDIHEAVE